MIFSSITYSDYCPGVVYNIHVHTVYDRFQMQCVMTPQLEQKSVASKFSSFVEVFNLPFLYILFLFGAVKYISGYCHCSMDISDHYSSNY